MTRPFFKIKSRPVRITAPFGPGSGTQEKLKFIWGYCSPGMSNADYNQLGILVKKFLSKKKLEAVSDIGGQIHGISLPSFLQMSEMEGATYTLKVASGDRVGYLYLDGGSLIAAQYEDQNGSAAAYRIISWDNAAIQIETADADREREIHEPLMHVMMESLKIKDEDNAGSAPPQSSQPQTVSPPADPSQTQKQQPPKKKGALSEDGATAFGGAQGPTRTGRNLCSDNAGQRPFQKGRRQFGWKTRPDKPDFQMAHCPGAGDPSGGRCRWGKQVSQVPTGHSTVRATHDNVGCRASARCPDCSADEIYQSLIPRMFIGMNWSSV